MKKNIFHGFTLVELIIVVTILSVLSTIAFISFQSYSKNARDSNRLTSITNIQKGISLNQIATSKTLLPDDYTQVLASGSLLGYEGIVGESVSRGIKLSSIPLDPSRGENYIYYTNKDRNKVQVMGFMEGESLAYLGIDKANAAGSGSKIPKVSGDRLGILLDGNNNRVTGTGVDILLTNSGTSYTTYFSNTDTLTSSGKDLYSNVYNRRSDLIKDTTFAILDDSLVGYWDMETTTLSGGVTVLKDLSKYGNNGACYNNGSSVNCGTAGQGPQFVSGNLKTGKAMRFDGIDDWVDIGNSDIFNGNVTILFWGYKTTYNVTHESILAKRDGWNSDLSDHRWNLVIDSPSRNLRLVRNSAGTVYNIFNTGSYQFFSITNNSNTSNFYKNGILLNTGSGFTYGSKTNAKIAIGRSGTQSAEYYLGELDEIRIYNRILSDLEIRELYNSTK